MTGSPSGTASKGFLSDTQVAELDSALVRAVMASRSRSLTTITRSWGLWQYFMVCGFGERPYRVYQGYGPTMEQRLADEWFLCRFVAWLTRRVKPNTAACYVSLVRTHHKVMTGQEIGAGLPMTRLSKVISGFADLFPSSPRDREVITPDMFKAWRAAIDWWARESINYTSLFETAMGALARFIELGCRTKNWTRNKYRVSRDDVEFQPSLENPDRVWLNMTPAKKPGGLSAHSFKDRVLLPYDKDAPTNAAFALQRLFQVDPCPKEEMASTPLFRRPGTKVPILYNDALKVLKHLARIIGRDPKTFGLHSFRIGGATALLAAGCPAETIKAMGRWNSDVYRLYCRADAYGVMKWKRAMGRAKVDPVQIHRKVREQAEVRFPGEPGHDPEQAAIVEAEFQEFDFRGEAESDSD